jgi:hypothetical protein
MTATDKSKANLKPFVKGDARINRKGTPRTAVVMREFIQQVGAETIKLPAANGEQGAEVTRIYALVRTMFNSKAPADRAAILKAIAPGLLREEMSGITVDLSILTTSQLQRLRDGEDVISILANPS